MDKITFDEVFQALAAYDPALWCGLAAAIATVVFELVLCKKGIIFSNANSKLTRAKQMGHILQGKMVKCTYVDRYNDTKATSRRYTATYEYYVDGVRRTKKVTSTSVIPPNNIDLYYLSSPEKVFSEFDIKTNPLLSLLYIIPLLVAFAVMRLLGFNA